MLGRVYSCAVLGLDGALVKVEVDIAPGLPVFNVVGLGDTAVQEARERVRAAIRNSGGTFLLQRITVNLAPADLRKAGPAYDLPIAVGVLMASGQLVADVSRAVFMGELGLDGTLRHTEGILPMVGIAQRSGMDTVFVPFEDAPEAAVIDGVTVIPVRTVAELAAHLSGERAIRPYVGTPPGDDEIDYPFDFADVRGQEHARRALEVAAAGGHNVLLAGTPGSGKTLMARALPSILPPMTGDEALDVTKIYSIGGKLPPGTPLLRRAPVSRAAPHHLVCRAGRRRQRAAPRRDLAGAPRRAVPGRAARVSEPGARSAAPAAGGPYGDDQPLGRHAVVSGQLYSRSCKKSLPLRVAQRRRARLHLPAGAHRALRAARVGAAAGPHRHPCRGAARAVRKAVLRAPGRGLGGDPAARGRSTRAAGAPRCAAPSC